MASDDVSALAEVLWFLPRPARPDIATKLVERGIRAHPELATLKIETPGPKQLANITPQYVVAIDRDALTGLRAQAPATAPAGGRPPRVLEISALADALWFLPRMSCRPIAAKLHGLGVRIDPQLATGEAQTTAPRQVTRHVDAVDKDRGLKVMRGMATQIGSAHLHELADRIEAADTDEKIAAERERLAPVIPESIKAVAGQLERAEAAGELDE